MTVPPLLGLAVVHLNEIQNLVVVGVSALWSVSRLPAISFRLILP